MKYFGLFALSLMSAALANASVSDTIKKVKPKQVAPPPTAQSWKTLDRLSLEGAADGVPYGLHLVGVEDKTVTLQWNNPEPMDGYFDDFEGHSDFVVNSSGNIGWDYLDMDNAYTYTWTATSFPNQGGKMAFMVMNVDKTSPSVADYPAARPYSGSKMLADFAVDGGNNDFIISPELSFSEDFQISFRAKSYTESYGLERVRVGYSTTGKRASDFVWVSEGDYIEVPAEWTLISYSIPKEAKYVTINCVSQDAFILFIDDIFVGTNKIRPRAASGNKLNGFNLYRGTQKVNSELIKDMVYADIVPEYGDYTYSVSAVYSDGTESAKSAVLSVNVPDIRLLPFEEDFSTWVLDADKWSTPVDGISEPVKWSVDYYTYGLVDPCATYQYSSLKNYSQSLVSRELNTTDKANTFLRFDLRTLNYENVTEDTLSVEISCGGKWTEVACYTNEEGTYAWRQELIDLSPYLTSNLFSIRFRAHGLDASYIDYWYVDDIKIWNPQWTSGKLMLMCGASPMANVPVLIEGAGGSRDTLVTGNDGTISISRLEADDYSLTVDVEDCNFYKGTWTVSASGSNNFTIQLTRPEVKLSTDDIHVDMNVEDKLEKTVDIKNEGDGEVVWRMLQDNPAGSGDISSRFQLQKDFNASGDLQSAVVFDGEFFYTSSWYNVGQFYKYDKNGEFLEEFHVEGMYYKVDDMAFDGVYFYGSDDRNTIFQIDMRNKRLVKTITIVDDPDINITHIAYDPRTDEFWVGASNTLCRVNREGRITVASHSISDDESLDIYGSAYDNVTPGGPYLWLSHEEISYEGVERIVLRQYNLNTRKLTDVKHEVSDFEGYQYGPMTYGAGIETTTSFIDGTLSLVGIMEQSPAHIFVYNLCNASDWLSYSPKAGVIKPGESQTVTLSYDARNGKVGETFEADLNLYTIPDAGEHKIVVGYTAAAPCKTPRPVSLTASSDNGYDVNLAWKSGEADKAPSGYNVYRNGVKLNSSPVAATSYVDKGVIRGNYYYSVTAIYDGKETNHSDSVAIELIVGAPYYAPTNLVSSVSGNKTVSLTWKQPGLIRQNEATLRYDNSACASGVGLSEGGFFWVGAKWDGDDLIEYRDMILDKVDVYVKERCTALSLRIYKDNSAAVTQIVNVGDIKYGQFNTVSLKSPLKIERGHEYIVSFLVVHDAGVLPIGMDDATAVEGKGNLISTDGKNWSTCTRMDCGNGNINIAVHFSPAADLEEAPVGYDVFRDGVKVNASTVATTSFKEDLTQAGVHTYNVRSVYADGGLSAFTSDASVEILQLGTPVAPKHVNADVELNRTVRLRWDFPIEGESSFPVDIKTAKVTTNEGTLEYVNQFDGSMPVEMGIASDGKYIYTTLYTAAGAINKYTLDGTFVESFVISGIEEGIRNLTYDGESFYASTTESFIYKIDMDAHAVSEKYSISEIARHIAYMPDLNGGRGGFEVGDWESSIYVNKLGAKISSGPVLKGAAGTAYYNGIIYAFEQGHENPFVITLYDAQTYEAIGSVDLKDYVELSPETGSAAGGMSLITTSEGLNLLAMVLQIPSNARFIFLDPGTIKGLEGYNVYRNGVKVNAEPLKYRSFEIEENEAGNYSYTVQTVYIDGTTSGYSPAAEVAIVEPGECPVPSDVKAVPASCGYNVNVSFVDPATLGADIYESAENIADDQPFSHDGWTNQNNAWTVSSDVAYQGSKSITSDASSDALLIMPVAHADGADALFSFVARNSDDLKANGRVVVYTSAEDSPSDADFVQYASVATTEAWQKSTFALPASVRYVAIKHVAGEPAQYVDAISMSTSDPELIHGYYVYRDGVKLNSEPVTSVSYTDHNLLPGTYKYQVSALYKTSELSELSDAVAVNVDYSNNFQAPGQLSAEKVSDGIRLDWSAPALGDAVNLKWHSGTVHDAAGLPSGGAFYAGVQWSAEELVPYESLSLSEVEVYVNQIPDQMFLLVYEGDDLVRQQYVPTLRQYSFNSIKLDNPLPLTSGRTLRVVIYVQHNEISVPLGYDEGPAKTSRGDLYSSDGVTWSTLTDNDIDGNWNITLVLRAYANNEAVQTSAALPDFTAHTSSANAGEKLMTQAVSEASSSLYAFDGYNVYCNGAKLTAEPISETTYLDREPKTVDYCEYQVKAVYSGYGEVGSNIVRVITTGIGGVEGYDGISIAASDGNIYVSGLASGENVYVYDSVGRMVVSAVAGKDSVLCISMSAVPEGVYMVKTSGKTAKINVTKR